MKIVVIGGSGLIGKKLAKNLRKQAVGADDRQRHMMADARGRFRGEEVPT